MAMAVSFKEVLDAFELVNFGSAHGEHEAFLCKQSGKVYIRFDEALVGEVDEKLPEDLDDPEKYLPIPNKHELDLGKRLVLAFAGDVMPADFDEIRRIFGRRGAYAAFKSLLVRRRALERWYDYEQKATERALRDWCEANEIALVD